MSERAIQTAVGLFLLMGVLALTVLAFRVSGLTLYSRANAYSISADFENIGDLKARAPVTIAGVRIGQVTAISLDKTTYKAHVQMQIENDENIPVDSIASIVTAGLLGANYVSLEPGFEETFLAEGEQIADTNPAIQLETLIGQFIFNMNKESD